ncbi:MAG: DUF1820 family protein [Geothermobacteraceae bacterium]
MSRDRKIFRIYFNSQGKSYELYAREVVQSELYGFVEIRQLLFGEKSSIVVDPSEESLKKEFGDVKSLLLPFQAISRIEQVEKEGPGKILPLAPTGQAGEAGVPPSGKPT